MRQSIVRSTLSSLPPKREDEAGSISMSLSPAELDSTRGNLTFFDPVMSYSTSAMLFSWLNFAGGAIFWLKLFVLCLKLGAEFPEARVEFDPLVASHIPPEWLLTVYRLPIIWRHSLGSFISRPEVD